MKVVWDEGDIRAGRHVWRDMECMLCCNPEDYRDPAVLVVLQTGRVMTIGTKQEVAEYMTKYEYTPTKER